MSAGIKTCYETAEENLFTLYETEAQGFFLLPYSALLVAHLPSAKPSANTEEALTLIYVTHTVVIKGSNLLAVMEPIQRGRAKRIFIGGDETGKNPVVKLIEITVGVKDEKAL